MSGILKICVQIFGACCGGESEAKEKRAKVVTTPKRSSLLLGGRQFVGSGKNFRKMSGGIDADAEALAAQHDYCIIHRSSTVLMTVDGMTERMKVNVEPKCLAAPPSESLPIRSTTKSSPCDTPEKRSVKNESGNIVNSVQEQLFDGMSALVTTALESLTFLICPLRSVLRSSHENKKARRKEKDSSGGSGLSAGSDEGKLYLESALLERHLNETELQRLVTMPLGLDENEWMASHTISLFEHVNLIYGTISEFCTSTTCPDMTGPCTRTYLWFDEKGKKVKVAAPQYVDYVMTFIQKTINDESIFPTKSTNAFPSSFKPIVKKICRLMFHVIAHIYHCHFKEIVLLSLHAHLNCIFAHFTIFNESFKLVEEKETEILQDLSLAMKLRSDLVVDDPMSDSNKENISVSKSTSGQGMFSPASSSGLESGDMSSGGSSRVGMTSTSSTTSTMPTFIPSSESLLKEPPALVINSELH